MKIVNDALIVLLKDRKDFGIAQKEFWYRIPTSSRLPKNLFNAKYIAFYFPKIFDQWKYSIRFFAEISNIEIVQRKELFPNELHNSKSEKEYYKISFGKIQELIYPIISQRGRMLLFIPTTFQKLVEAKELNDVFNDSPLENKLWSKLKSENLPAERQFLLRTNEKNWVCDFAFFCKQGTIDVECDGDEFHTSYEAVIYDKVRNNEIEAVANWDVLRFTTLHIEKEMDWTIRTIKRKIDKLGGLYFVQEDQFKYVSKSDSQLNLFS
jgi:very-short-patch-repair endonuclease